MTRLTLSPKQAQVLAAASDGVPLAEVGRRLNMPREQVAARMSEAYKRLGVTWMDRSDRRAAAVRTARRHGLIPPTDTATATTPESDHR